VEAALKRVFPAITSPLGRSTMGWPKPIRQIDAATCGTASSFRRGFAGEQKRRSVTIHSTLSFVVSKSMGVPFGNWLDLEGGGLGGLRPPRTL
jgi:hypothetical protein